MSRLRATSPPLPPPSRAACWREFAKWALGVPLLIGGALGIVWIALWITGSGEMVWQATRDMGTVLLWLALIALMYPAMLFIWVADLRAGLRAARDWDDLSDAERDAAHAAAVPPRRQRKGS